MSTSGYRTVQPKPGMWVHDSRNTIFILVVNNFCVQNSLMENADHFKISSEQKSRYIQYGKDSLYWNQIRLRICAQNRYIVNSEFQHILMGDKEYYPHICAPMQYTQKIQYKDPLDTAEYLFNKETNLIQQICSTFLYYAIATNKTILPELRKISSER